MLSSFVGSLRRHVPAEPRWNWIIPFSLLGAHVPAHAQALFTDPVKFNITMPCKATNGIRTNAGAISLGPGSSYTAVGENRVQNATHVYIKVGGAQVDRSQLRGVRSAEAGLQSTNHVARDKQRRRAGVLEIFR
jgi:hypothetical protein